MQCDRMYIETNVMRVKWYGRWIFSIGTVNGLTKLLGSRVI